MGRRLLPARRAPPPATAHPRFAGTLPRYLPTNVTSRRARVTERDAVLDDRAAPRSTRRRGGDRHARARRRCRLDRTRRRSSGWPRRWPSAGSPCGRTPRPTRASRSGVGRSRLAHGGLTVGTIGEAEVVRAAGLDDLFIAYPLVPRRSQGRAPAGRGGPVPADGRVRLGRRGAGHRRGVRRASAAGSACSSRSTAVAIAPGCGPATGPRSPARRLGWACSSSACSRMAGTATPDRMPGRARRMTRCGHWPRRRPASPPPASNRSVVSAGSTPTARRLGPRRRHRGAAGHVRVRRPRPGRAGFDRPDAVAATVAARGQRRRRGAPVRRRCRGEDPEQGRRRATWSATGRSRAWAARRLAGQRLPRGRPAGRGRPAAGGRAGRDGRPEPHLPGREPRGRRAGRARWGDRGDRWPVDARGRNG